jgi:hypothetical protein
MEFPLRENCGNVSWIILDDNRGFISIISLFDNRGFISIISLFDNLANGKIKRFDIIDARDD